MEVFRISRQKFSDKLTASGSPNRWNYDGQRVIYTGSYRSLSTLELVVHRGSIKPSENYKVMVISIQEEDRLFNQVSIGDLPKNWRKMAAYSVLQEIGAKWYKSKDSLVLKVPSAVIPYEFNYLINAEHPEFAKNVKLERTEDYFWDTRLLGF